MATKAVKLYVCTCCGRLLPKKEFPRAWSREWLCAGCQYEHLCQLIMRDTTGKCSYRTQGIEHKSFG